MSSDPSLPIDDIRGAFLASLAEGPVVVSSPTGSGKSTQVPRWCEGRVLVVEPRRVACRSLAERVAELEGTSLGGAVGYQVRDERRAGKNTRILFATPGIVLRIFDRLADFDTVILDEFHERSLDVDLLLALLQGRARTVVMSATLEGERVAAYLGGRHLHAEGRTHPVDIRHMDGGALLPDTRGLEGRVLKALESTRDIDGDVLIFLPGKAEIANCERALATSKAARGVDVLTLHGGLSLKEQGRAFQPSARRKVVLATNVAETSITLPGTTVVIDSGLVRRTRYHRGRGFLTLSAIARDSADQRTGRAGRVRPGVAIRLWSESAQLEKRTPPEMYRESLVPLVLAASACGSRIEELNFPDPPRDHAIEAAVGELRALEALGEDGRLTRCGRELFGLPLDAPLGRLLVEAKATTSADEAGSSVLEDFIDLVAVLSTGRPLLTSKPRRDDDASSPASARASSRDISRYCDASLLLEALRASPGRNIENESPPPNGAVLREARAVRRRLRRAYELADVPPEPRPLDRRRLALTVLAADPRAAHVVRRRGRRTAWSNGGTEIELGRQSAVGQSEEDEVVALVVLETRAVDTGREAKTLITHAMPVPLDWLLEAGLGRDRLDKVQVEGKKEGGRVVSRIERVYARRVLAVREEVPEGDLARQAVEELFLCGSIFRSSLETSRENLRLASLARQILAAPGGAVWEGEVTSRYPEAVPSLEEWARDRVIGLGVESGEDLALLSADDFLAPELPEWVRSEIDRSFPRTLQVLGATYDIEYDLPKREALLVQVKGKGPRHQIPPEFALPKLPGFKIKIEHRGTLRTLRG